MITGVLNRKTGELIKEEYGHDPEDKPIDVLAEILISQVYNGIIRHGIKKGIIPQKQGEALLQE